MSGNKNINNPLEKVQDEDDSNLAAPRSDIASVTSKSIAATDKERTTAERQIKFERAQKCLENAALVSKKIKEHRKATAQLLGRPFEDDNVDTQSELATAMSEKTGYSVATDTSTTLSVQDALNIPGISESLANTLKQKELLMERIKQYKEISKRPMKSTIVKKEVALESTELKKSSDTSEVTKLMNVVKDKENALSVMQVKLKAMETTILDLQEKINEKDQIIEAKNKATTLISDSLTKKEKDTLDLLEDTKEQMAKMQQNFVAMESEWKEEKQKLVAEIEEKDEKIKSLTEANTILENSRFEISIAHSQLSEELEAKSKQIQELQEKISKLSEQQEIESSSQPDIVEEKGSKEIADMEELTKKIELLEHINYQIRQTNKELENQLLATSVPDTKPSIASSPSKKGSPLPTRKGGRNTAAKLKSPWSKLSQESLQQESDKKSGKATGDSGKSEMLLQALNKDILDKEYIISQKDTLINNLQSEMITKDDIINELKSQVSSQIQEIPEKIDVQTDTEKLEDKEKQTTDSTTASGDVKDYEEKLKLAHDQIALLNNEIDTANKNMIKVKSSSKLKLKQMQKTIENFSKVSDAHAEIVRLNEEIHQLSQKVAELEEEKGNLQLHLVDYDSGRLTDTDVYKKMVEMENLAEARLKSISLLETQKFDLVQELHLLQQKNAEMEDKLADISQLQNEQVCSEMKSVQLEEQIDELCAAKKELELVIENIKLDKEQLEGNIKALQTEKEELVQKLESYIQENIELTDKLEKLSAEKVSSAESIEIVDSLTTQEKLEIEEYNKGLERDKTGEIEAENKDASSSRQNVTIDQVLVENDELKNKIELFTQERQEVMEKMNNICAENSTLHKKIEELENQCQDLEQNITILNNEKSQIQGLNEELNSQIEELKRERIEIVKESADIKPLITEDSVDSPLAESHHEDKSAAEKAGKGAKSLKQLTKEILKLKNVIKEREAEIADCQMKILSLEEQQQKYTELLQTNVAYETKIKQLGEENKNLKLQIDSLASDTSSEQEQLHLKNTIESLHQELQKVQRDYNSAITNRDVKIQELEYMLKDYENQILNYSNTLQQKDKEINEYINQVTKLNDVSLKLKSTIESLEEEKAKDQNADMVKSLNKQIALYQNALGDCEEKLRKLEEEKSQLLSLKSKLENKNMVIETELTNLKQTLSDNQKLVEELQSQQHKQKEEYLEIMTQAKERDEEIHEIKLQLRKESIENEKLRTAIQQKDTEIKDISKQYQDTKDKFDAINQDQSSQSDQFTALENKNKELIEKLKKFALSIKKKSALYTELENQYNDLQKQLEAKSNLYDQAMIQVETIPALQEKIQYANEELSSRLAEKNLLERKYQETYAELTSIQQRYEEEIFKLNESITLLNKDLYLAREENLNLQKNLESVNNKLVEYEIDQKNNANLLTKISCLEAELNQKQLQITELNNQVQNQEQNFNQLQYGHDAKVQERDMYIENLQIEMEKYKNRICRLEESISVMENRRQSLERKADQLDTQLQDKQKSYSEYTTQEDELVTRLAALMDHDRVLEKQVHEIENDNKELQYKLQYLNEELQNLQKSYSDLQQHSNTLEEKASRTTTLEAENLAYQAKVESLETNLKKLSIDHQNILAQRKVEIDDLETEFNTQIEEAIKEKKILSEKYEKLCEHVTRLESEVQGYKSSIETLHINLDELSAQNSRLVEKANIEKPTVPDYTEQYICEINKLNAALNSKNQQINELDEKLRTQHNHLNSLKVASEQKINDLSTKLTQTLQNLEALAEEHEKLKCNHEELSNLLHQKEEQIKQLMEKKKVVFEMNIPKTEGMTISSTIEEMSDEQRSALDISALQSQILTDADIANIHVEPIVKREIKHSDKSMQGQSLGGSIEPIIVPKKTYECVKTEDEEQQDADPFNSDEGWGLEGNIETYEVMPGTSQLHQEIQTLKEKNDNLKKELDAANSKLIKAIKKLKELKSTNEMLSNELKISKQISNSSILDMAIESELSNNVELLEKKVNELNDIISKDKKEKDALSKQNEVLKNANERLIEMKEKLDNELELWKYNFKQVNDKISSQQQAGDIADVNVISSTVAARNESQVAEEITKLERENDELQGLVDNLTSRNKELTEEITKLKSEVTNLTNTGIPQKQFEALTKELDDFRVKNADLNSNCTKLNDELSELQYKYNELVENIKSEKTNLESQLGQLESDKEALTKQIEALQYQIQSLTQEKEEAFVQIASLKETLDNANTKLEETQQTSVQVQDMTTLSENYNTLNLECENLKLQLENACKTIKELEDSKGVLIKNSESYKEQIKELELKLQQLNSENDQLLSTVTELRSSISSAMDQRGFEIAELWKQHLAQREGEFQQIEQDLRAQLSASESKYEQLLDSVQSSTQEETSKIVVMEQVSSLQIKVQEKEEQLNALQDKYADVMHQLDMLRSEMQDERVENENKILVQQEEYEKTIKELRDEIVRQSEHHTSQNALELELVATKTVNDSLNQRIEELNLHYESKLADLTKQIKQKESEIFQKTHDYTIMLADRNSEFENVRQQLIEYEKKVEDLTYEKESELAVLRLKMHENGEQFERMRKELEEEKIKISEALNAKIIECTNLNKQIHDLNKMLEEYANKAAETQLVLESQELEIVTLKDEIESMKDVMRSASSKIEKHVTFASGTKESAAPDTESALDKELLDAVPKAELDLALYMLHQRDVRCEELTMELTQLLEERDTLQLRLSDSLRSYEELKSRYGSVGLDTSTASSQDTVSDLPSFTVEKESQFVDTHRAQSSRSSSISEMDGDKPKLQAKLSELRSVKHSRDVRLRNDSEQRQIGMRLLHRDVANLPPEAVQQLSQAHHTLSRDSQSTPTVLLNWLRGKSTPKVVHM